ncbi:MAG: response regulator transcription factor [Chitinophagaceae bacterium]
MPVKSTTSKSGPEHYLATGTTHVLVIEDDLMVAEHIITCLEVMQFGPMLYAGRPEQVQQHMDQNPWLVICDVNLGQPLDGIQLMHIHRTHHPYMLIYITAMGDYATVQRALATNPDFYLLKPFSNAQLQITIKQAADKWQRTQHQDTNALPSQTGNPYTKRELEILELIHKGLLSKEIAYLLNISEGTIQTHRKHILEKAACNNTHEAVYIALQNGWI